MELTRKIMGATLPPPLYHLKSAGACSKNLPAFTTFLQFLNNLTFHAPAHDLQRAPILLSEHASSPSPWTWGRYTPLMGKNMAGFPCPALWDPNSVNIGRDTEVYVPCVPPYLPGFCKLPWGK